MTARRIGSILMLSVPLAALGCSAKQPVLYPNWTYRQAGVEVVESDIAECMAAAEAYGDPAGMRTAVSTGQSAATGAAAGAAAGAIRGGAGTGAAFGAAGAAAAGLVRGLFAWRDPDPIEARFVNQCLADKGYQTIGWR